MWKKGSQRREQNKAMMGVEIGGSGAEGGGGACEQRERLCI